MTAVFLEAVWFVTLFLSVSVHIDAPHDSHGACSYFVFIKVGFAIEWWVDVFHCCGSYLQSLVFLLTGIYICASSYRDLYVN